MKEYLEMKENRCRFLLTYVEDLRQRVNRTYILNHNVSNI